MNKTNFSFPGGSQTQPGPASVRSPSGESGKPPSDKKKPFKLDLGLSTLVA